MMDSSIKAFCETYKFCSLVKGATCFKNPKNPSCIDLILKNKHISFWQSCAIETGLSEFHKMVPTVMKMHFPKWKPRIITYRKYNFRNSPSHTYQFIMSGIHY